MAAHWVKTQHGSDTATITGKVHFLQDLDGEATLNGVAGLLQHADVGLRRINKEQGETAEHHQKWR